ncbi:hypothetical protein [Miltoncostaea marina]|uniref:hypothetical protein n=1 Tax=Miltoncostaea marina TaxID=2843215 RepID=UPI001C3CA991|nr:hypothetical protein [Miltoncostaea marina]
MFWLGGVAAGVLLIVLGAIWIYLGVDSRDEVHDTIAREQIVGSPDMSPDTFEGEPVAGMELPDCDVAGEPIDNGTEARCFADWMRVHTLESTGGRTFSEMGRFLTEDGEETSNPQEAATDPETGQPKSNPSRDLWVTQRALATGLELSFVGEQISLFALATGIVFLIIGIGLLVMLTAGGVLRGATGAGGAGPGDGDAPAAP